MTTGQVLGGWLAQAAAVEQLSDCDILAELRALPVESRILIYLADVKGLAYQEIAETTGVPTEAVAPRLYQARCRLAQRAVCAVGVAAGADVLSSGRFPGVLARAH
jgi:hypothetical protein